jgi:hypothetical protein
LFMPRQTTPNDVELNRRWHGLSALFFSI